MQSVVLFFPNHDGAERLARSSIRLLPNLATTDVRNFAFLIKLLELSVFATRGSYLYFDARTRVSEKSRVLMSKHEGSFLKLPFEGKAGKGSFVFYISSWILWSRPTSLVYKEGTRSETTNMGKVSLRKISFSNFPRTSFCWTKRSLPRPKWLKKPCTIAPSPKPGWSRLVQTGLVWDQLVSVTPIVCSRGRWGLLKTGRSLASTRELEANWRWSSFPSVFMRKPSSDPLLPINVRWRELNMTTIQIHFGAMDDKLAQAVKCTKWCK